MNSQDNPIFLSRLTKWDVFKATWLVFFLNLIYVPQKSRFTRFFIHIIYFLATIFFILSLNNANFFSKIICLLGIFSPLIMTIYAAFFCAQQYPTPTLISLFSLIKAYVISISFFIFSHMPGHTVSPERSPALLPLPCAHTVRLLSTLWISDCQPA